MPRTHAFLAGLAGVVLAAGRAHAADYNCIPAEAMVVSNRIHVRCAEPRDIRGGYPKDGDATIVYFAVPLTNEAWANRFLDVANTALTAGLMIQFKYTSGDTSGTAFGCAAHDCRTPWGFLLLGRGQSRTP